MSYFVFLQLLHEVIVFHLHFIDEETEALKSNFVWLSSGGTGILIQAFYLWSPRQCASQLLSSKVLTGSDVL
jgi:hypothetical protein